MSVPGLISSEVNGMNGLNSGFMSAFVGVFRVAVDSAVRWVMGSTSSRCRMRWISKVKDAFTIGDKIRGVEVRIRRWIVLVR